MEFSKAIQFILNAEGGYVNHPKDPGGETNYGISKRSYPNLDIKNLTKEAATEIYFKDFWQRLSIDSLPPMLRLPVFDCAVNQGPHFAIGTLQAVLGVAVDGKIGPVTLQKASSCSAERILSKYMWRRLEKYQINSKWGTFGTGWALRLLHIYLF